MSSLGEEFTTEFGEFLDFDSGLRSDDRYEDPFRAWIPIADMDMTKTQNFAKIAEAVAKAKEELEKRKQ